ncbi:MAG: MlaD family protein [Planctomycetota bacterium]|jgi:ABC-type transporter Mla subunit MlaD
MPTNKGAQYKAGIVILAGVVILLLGLFLVSGGADQFRDKKRFYVLFTNGGGIGGGDRVFLAGRKAGRVVSVAEVEDTVNGVKGTYISVEVEVFEDSHVHLDSDVTVSKTVTGIVTMNIEFGSSGELAPPGAKLRGRKLSSFEEAVDNGTQLLASARSVVKRMDDVLAVLHKDAEALDIDGLRERAVTLLERLDKVIANTGKEVDTVLDDTDDGVKELTALVKDLRKDWAEMAESLKQTLDRANSAAGELDAILKENRPGLKLAVQGLADGAQKVAPALAQIEQLGQAAEGLVLEIKPSLSQGLRSAAAAFKNFEAVVEDLRTAPWKLINEPSAKEVYEVHLYNAARNYVQSASDIQSVLDRLDALRGKEGFSESTKGKLEELTQALQASLNEYGKREKALVALIEQARNGK